MSDDLKKDINAGGTIETALSGKYELKAGDIIKEAWQLTMKNFMSFTPTVMLLLLLQIGIFYIALKLQIGDISIIWTIMQQGGTDIDQMLSISKAIMYAKYSEEILCAPLVAGACLMAMSHTTGFKTQLKHILQGFYFSLPIMLMTSMSLLLQFAADSLIPLVSIYLTIAFSNANLLICEKRITPMRSLLLSMRAVNKKILTVTAVYAFVTMMFFASLMFYGVGVILVLPFYLHVKGIIYRDMFGIRLRVTTGGNPPSNNKGNKTQVFDA